MKKLILILALAGTAFSSGLFTPDGLDGSKRKVRTKQNYSQWRVCNGVSYVGKTPKWTVDSVAGDPWSCVRNKKRSGKDLIGISSLKMNIYGSSTSDSIKILIKTKDRPNLGWMNTYGVYRGSNSIAVDSIVTPTPLDGGTVFTAGGLFIPDADSVCVRVQPHSGSYSAACATDSAWISQMEWNLK